MPDGVEILSRKIFMWIRLMLLVAFAVGLNCAVSTEIKKQHKQSSLAVADDAAEVKKLYTYARIPSAKQRAIDRRIIMQNRDLRQRLS